MFLKYGVSIYICDLLSTALIPILKKKIQLWLMPSAVVAIYSLCPL